MLRELIKTKLRLLYLEGGERMSRHLVRSIFSAMTFSIFAYFTFVVVKFATGYIIKDAKLGLFLYHRLLALGLFVFFAIVSVANTMVAFSTIFRNKEAEFLHTLPIKPVEIFISKFLDSFLYSSALMLVLILAAIAGYAGYFHNAMVGILGIILAIFPLILSAACIGAIVLLLVLKFSTKMSIRAAVLIVTIFYAGGTYLYIRLNNPFRLFSEVMKYYPHIDRYLGGLDPKPDYFAPSFWSANFFYFATTGNLAGAAASALIVCGIAAGLFVLMVKLAERYYQDAFWVARHKLFERKVGKFASSDRDNVDSSLRKGLFERNPVTLLRRDFLLFFREPSQTFHFAVLLILIGIFLFNLFTMRIYLPDTLIITSAFTLIFAFNSFLVVSLAVRFVYPMLSLEGESMWLLRSSPIELKKVFNAKFLPSVIFLSSIGILLGFAAPLPFKSFRGLIPVSMAYGFIGGIIFPSVVMIFGGLFVDYREKNAVRISSSHGATISLLVSVGMMVILGSVVFNQTFSYFTSRGSLPADLYGIWILGIISVVCVALARVFGMRALEIDL
jgi:ABC-2 type transport system permease protein